METKQPTEAQIKEFWERLGLTYRNDTGYHGWYRGIGYAGLEWCGDELVIDPNNLFKHAVPKALEKLRKQGSAIPLISLFTAWYDKIVALEHDSSKLDTVALALFWVIWEVMHDKA